MSDGYTILTLDEVETATHRDSTLIPIRHHLGFRAVGVNAWKADLGDQLIPPHTEESGNEELFGTTPAEEWVDVDPELASELSDRLTRLGYDGDLDDALRRWAGNANLEERVAGAERIDPVVLDALRSA